MADSKRIDREHDTDMVIVVFIGVGIVTGRKVIAGFPGGDGLEDKFSDGQIRIGGNLSEIGDFIAGRPVGAVDAGPFSAAALDRADDKANAVAGSVEEAAKAGKF